MTYVRDYSLYMRISLRSSLGDRGPSISGGKSPRLAVSSSFRGVFSFFPFLDPHSGFAPTLSPHPASSAHSNSEQKCDSFTMQAEEY
jgi:hypothetical protein